MYEQTTPATPIVRAAIASLDAFGALSAREATILLGYWARRDQLTAVDVEQVIAHYSAGAAPVVDDLDDLDDDRAGDDLDDDGQGDDDGTGLDYDRADTAPGPQPIPPHRDGWFISGRGGAR